MTSFDSERWRRLQPILDRALSLPPEERSAWLDEACASDAPLRADAEALLHADAEAGGILDAPVGASLGGIVNEIGLEETRSTTVERERVLTHQRLGDFEIIREIGRGGMGVVYEAEQVSLRRKVALKVLPPGLGLTAQAIARFEREARAAAQLHHTNIVPVHAIGEHEGCHYYAMELVRGEPLSRVLEHLRGEGGGSRLLEASPTNISDASTGSRAWFDGVAKVVAEVAEALQYAHEQGIVHRDVKPSNLMLAREGRLCLTDFGLARVAQEPGMTVTGSFLGTPAYMSPEQVAAGRVKVDHRTDVYSLGAVLYELLTLKRPFPGGTRDKVLAAIMAKEPRAPRRINPRVPLDLETICLKAMEKDPDRRYATAGALAADLRAYLQRGLIAARRTGPVRRGVKWVRRHPVIATAVAGAALVVLSAGVAWQSREARRHEAVQRAIAEARYLEKNRDSRKALARVEAALALDPGNLEALSLRGNLRMYAGHLVEAARDAEAVLRESPEDWRSHAVLAYVALDLFGVQTIPAQEHIEAVERLAPRAADALAARAVLAARNEPQNALPLLNQALELEPGHSTALYHRVLANLAQGRFEAARSDAERLRIAAPSSGYMSEANIHLMRGELESALASIEKALGFDPEDPYLFGVRSQIYRAMGRSADAVADATRAIQLDPTACQLHYDRSETLRSLSRIEEALADARQEVEINPDGPAGHMLLLRILSGAKRWDLFDAAVDRLERRVESWRNDDPRYMVEVAIIRAQIEQGRVSGALEAVEKTIERGGKDAWIFATRAELLSYRSPADCDRILADLRKAESLAPEDLFGAFALSWVYGTGIFSSCPAQYDQGRALGLAQRAADAARGAAAVHRNLGLVLYRGARYREAREALNEAVALSGTEADPDTLFLLAMTERQLGANAAARAAYDRASARMQQTRPDDPATLLLRNEAARLLSIR